MVMDRFWLVENALAEEAPEEAHPVPAEEEGKFGRSLLRLFAYLAFGPNKLYRTKDDL